MNAAPPLPTLQEAPRIGLIGAVHGELGLLHTVARSLADRGVRILLALGGLGLSRPGSTGQSDLQKLTRQLADLGQVLYLVDGSTPSHDQLGAIPIDADGLRHFTPNVLRLPRVYRTTLASGRTLAALCGAHSLDRHERSDADGWAAEAITDADLTALGPEHADILVGQNAPLDILSLDRWLAEGAHRWPAKSLAHALQGREILHRGLLQTTPELYLGGHHRRHIDEAAGFMTDNRGFATRTVMLDALDTPGAVSTAILDADTLSLHYFSRDGIELPSEHRQVTDLTTQEHGRWLLHTIGSRHVIDLDARTVERLPGPHAHATTSDGLHRLRTLDLCRIGDVGRWTMHGDDFVEYYWHQSSIIRHIEPAPADPETAGMSLDAGGS